MPKEQRGQEERTPFLRLEPERRLCAVYDADDFAELQTAEEMGFRDLDDFCQEHIQ